MADLSLITQAVDALNDVDKLHASIKLAEVRVPGIWVRLLTVEHDSLDGESDQLGVELVAIVKDRDPARVYKDLFDLHDQVQAVLGIPDDVCRVVTVNHPEGGSLPGLSIPYQLL